MNVTRSDVFAKQIKYILMQVQRMKSEVLDATKKLEVREEVVFKKQKSYINSHEYFCLQWRVIQNEQTKKLKSHDCKRQVSSDSILRCNAIQVHNKKAKKATIFSGYTKSYLP